MLCHLQFQHLVNLVQTGVKCIEVRSTHYVTLHANATASDAAIRQIATNELLTLTLSYSAWVHVASDDRRDCMRVVRCVGVEVACACVRASVVCIIMITLALSDAGAASFLSSALVSAGAGACFSRAARGFCVDAMLREIARMQVVVCTSEWG